MDNLDEFLAEGNEWFERYIETIREYANKLRESEKWLSTMLNSIDDAVIATDKQGLIYFMNPVAETLTGWKQEESKGKPLEEIFNIISEKTRKKVVNPVSRVLQKGIVVGLADHTVLIAKDGREIPIEDSGAPIKNNQGSIIGVVLIFRDSTLRRELERELSVAYDAIGSSINGVIITNLAGKITYVNPTIVSMFEYDGKEAMLGKSASSLFPSEKIQKFSDVTAIIDKIKGNVEIFTACRKDNSEFPVEVSSSIVTDKEGNEVGRMASFFDITERKKLEEKLIKQEAIAYSENIVETIREPLIVLDKDLRVIFANNSFYDTFKVSPEETEAKLLYNLGNKQWDIPTLRKLLEEILPNNTKIETYEVEYDFETIGNRIMILNARRIYGGTHKTQNILLAIEDITERKIAEENLKESEENYRRAYNWANFYKDLLAHDMNNILQSVLSGMQLSEAILYDASKHKELKTSIRIMQNQIIRGADLISNIHKLSQLEESEIPIKKIEICNMLKTSISYLKETYKDKNINIQVHSISEKLHNKANEFLEDVFENILLNAVKHNKSPSVEITVNITREKKNSINYLKIEFLDNGKGINDKRKEIIFKRGFTKEKGVHGMGLGLSLVKKIIDIYNGEIWVEDRIKGDYSKGSNFVLLIPEVD